jgi:hypothetical protein
VDQLCDHDPTSQIEVAPGLAVEGCCSTIGTRTAPAAASHRADEAGTGDG